MVNLSWNKVVCFFNILKFGDWGIMCDEWVLSVLCVSVMCYGGCDVVLCVMLNWSFLFVLCNILYMDNLVFIFVICFFFIRCGWV